LLRWTFLLTTQWDPEALAQARILQGEVRDWLACEFMQPAVDDEGRAFGGEGKAAAQRSQPAYPPHP
jgi:hypothetical protein